MAQAPLKNRIVKMTGPLPEDKIYLKAAKIEEGLSKLTEITVDFLSTDLKLKLGDMVGKNFTLSVMRRNETWRHFHGIAVELSTLGAVGKFAMYQVRLRPWMWMLTRRRDSRIFQEMSALDVIKKVFSEAGFSDIQDRTSINFRTRTYCVQYRESDYDFVCRLMEEEGMYFYFTHEESKHTLVLADGIGGHSPIAGETPNVLFKDRQGGGMRRHGDHMFQWYAAEAVTVGKVTFDDWQFERTTTDQKVVKAMPKGSHNHKDYEHYDYQHRYTSATEGEHVVKVRMESLAVPFETKYGLANVRTMATGATFALTEHERDAENADYLMIAGEYELQIEQEALEELDGYDPDTVFPGQIELTKGNSDAFRVKVSAIPKATQYRAPQVTRWPEISGVHTAIVTGPSGEEIYTDKYGRIKVQFHWDRDGQLDETTTCFIRHMTPWSGKNWGMIHIPRIGQEVVVQFEEGNPDRPIVIGMLYNNETMPPYTLPDKMNESGIVTRSTKSGSPDTFHELMFVDTKEAEDIRFQSERDYHQIIKNNADITIGMEHQDEGSLTQTIHKSKTETIKTGDDTLTVEQGNQIVSIKTDQTETIEGKADRTVTGNVSETISQGNYTQDITAGKGTVTAAQSFEIVVGASSIKLTPGSIEVKAPMIKLEATGALQAKAGGAMKMEAGAALQAKAGGAMKMEAGGILQAQAGGVAKVSAGGALVLSGTVAKIN